MSFRSSWPDVAIPNLPYSDFVFAEVAAHASQDAFIDGPSGRVLTHGEVHRAAQQLATALVQRGLRKGDRCAIVAPNLPEYAIVLHGVAMAGGVVTTANPHASVDDLAWQFADAGVRFVFTVPASLDRVREAAARTAIDGPLFLIGDGAPRFVLVELLRSRTVTLADLLAEAHHATTPTVSINPRTDLLMLPYSSGTTGRFKGVMLTHRNAVAMLAMLEPLAAPNPQSQRTLAVAPFFHAMGMGSMNTVLRRGTTAVTMPRFDFEQYLQLIERHRITALMVVPSVLLALAKHPAAMHADLSSVRSIGCGAAPLDAALQQATSDRLKVPVRQAYGMTEMTAAVSSTPIFGAALKPGSVGKLLPNIEARIVSTTTGSDLGPNERGELWLRGPNLMCGYWHAPEATADTIDAQGWLHTGDIALIDADGELFIVDRLKELIKVKGYQVAPAQLEGVLLEHPAVVDAAVIGVPDDEAGERPMAFVVRHEHASTTAEQLMAHCAQRLAPYARIRDIEFVDAIPKSATGKILRRELRERVSASVAATQ